MNKILSMYLRNNNNYYANFLSYETILPDDAVLFHTNIYDNTIVNYDSLYVFYQTIYRVRNWYNRETITRISLS